MTPAPRTPGQAGDARLPCQGCGQASDAAVEAAARADDHEEEI